MWEWANLAVASVSIVFAGVALWFSKESTTQASRSADASEDSNRAAWHSAEAAKLSADAAAVSVEIQKADWNARRTACLRVQEYLLVPKTYQVNVEPEIEGIHFVLENVGGASAVDVGVEASVTGQFTSSEKAIPNLPPGQRTPSLLRFEKIPKDREINVTVRIQYQDIRAHTQIVHFVLVPQPKEFLERGKLAGPILLAISLDEGSHPAHEDLSVKPSEIDS